MNAWLKSTAAAAALSVAMASGAAAQDDNQETKADGAVLQDIVTNTHDEFGDYLTGGRMMALYMFTADEQGTDESDPVTNCTDGCSRHGRR